MKLKNQSNNYNSIKKVVLARIKEGAPKKSIISWLENRMLNIWESPTSQEAIKALIGELKNQNLKELKELKSWNWGGDKITAYDFNGEKCLHYEIDDQNGFNGSAKALKALENSLGFEFDNEFQEAILKTNDYNLIKTFFEDLKYNIGEGFEDCFYVNDNNPGINKYWLQFNYDIRN